MQTIYRFEVPVDDRPHSFFMTPGPSFGPRRIENKDNVTVEFWAEVLTGQTIQRRFQVVGTGHKLPEGSVYVGSAPRNRAGLVWHLVEV
jgi:hypothetical protein